MSTEKVIVLVTGGPASGKTSLLKRVVTSTGRSWRTCGILSHGSPRAHLSAQRSASYDLEVIGFGKQLPWARLCRNGSGFEFSETTRERASLLVGSDLEQKEAEICFLDEIGHLEVTGHGFDALLRIAISSPTCRVLVAAVKKDALKEVTRCFGIESADIIDLDSMPSGRAHRLIKGLIERCDTARIGTYSGIAGLLEVGLGSTLHAYRVPFKGHLLAYLQNLLLISFGKSLNGRGLVRISVISAMLKAFSPMGARLRPMLYIFLQGSLFAAPIRLLGWRFVSVLLGSLLMGWFALGLSLALKYTMFGASIFDAYSGAIGYLGDRLGTRNPSLLSVICGVFVLKGVLSTLIATGAYFGSIEWLVRRVGATPRSPLSQNADSLNSHANVGEGFHKSRPSIAWEALRDLCSPRFVLPFLVSILLLLFFADLTAIGFTSIALRGLCISYLGFLLLRRVDIRALGSWIDRRFALNLEESLPLALQILRRSKSRSEDTQLPDSSQ